MFFKWLKQYTPRGIYGRAALILIVPVLSILIVGSIIFVQRHYEDVTGQMTDSLSLDLKLVLARIDNADNVDTAVSRARQLADPLELELVLPAAAAIQGLKRHWYDFAASSAMAALDDTVANVAGLDLVRSRAKAFLQVETRFGLAEFSFARTRIAASNPHQFLVLMVFVAAVMVLISTIFLRNQMRPIRRLARASEAFGKGQIVPLKPAGAIEVRSASNAFLEMRARIERQIEQRTLMLSGVSHDLRTPLTRMKLELSMIDDQSAAAALMRDVDEMERLLDSFLEFVRSDAVVEPEPREIRTFLQGIVQKVDSGQTLTLALPEEEVTAIIRPMALERAVTNLVLNAVRYGTKVRVGLEVGPRFMRIAVEDDGPGIAEVDRERALQPFVRLDQSRNQNSGSGVGLGLAIAHDIARRHGGNLVLGSSDRLGGLRAEIVLPVSSASRK